MQIIAVYSVLVICRRILDVCFAMISNKRHESKKTFSSCNGSLGFICDQFEDGAVRTKPFRVSWTLLGFYP